MSTTPGGSSLIRRRGGAPTPQRPLRSIYLSDSGTPIINRSVGLLNEGAIEGVILSPFTTPRYPEHDRKGGRSQEDILRCVKEIGDTNGHILLDAQTHAVDFPGANSFDRYDVWSLWDGER